ncbi:hypothetical protein B1J93_18495 [Leptospira kirschneri serovar Pomona]|uniref:Uncharacterized protein n=1 Tax=Leptospira kirschneri serovar Pomona TaxID=561005 RepID=A0A1T1DHJ9_9LEPT|nr:hypothetical protein LEP1GSC166_1649 [Leptospira kirschneri]OOV40307.1 hypothetical protein B1J93_18495 [Leptospira kirschneri serovar Pomona]
MAFNYVFVSEFTILNLIEISSIIVFEKFHLVKLLQLFVSMERKQMRIHFSTILLYLFQY